ncbi:MAG TPA: alkaline phosphatase family protein [Acidimicrobiales bacterium]|nr:alkaline phosphatase family protein [Acidimicrobiales bacterium]
MRWRLLLAGLVLAAVAAHPTAAPAATGLPPIKHVFVLIHENESADASWGPSSPAKYLARTLRAQGKYLSNYYATGHASLDNYITMISGQPPNIITQADCLTFSDFTGIVGPDGIAIGQGCVYPTAVKTLADQLEAKGLTWRGYMEDMGNNAVRDNGTTCAHPNIGLLEQDHTQSATVGDQYATRHNPFAYFHSIIDEPSCHANVVPLTRLTADLASEATTANFIFITPNLCNDGHDGPCVDGQPGGLTGIDKFTEKWAPRIMNSPAFKNDGLLIVTFDESEVDDSSACCSQPTGPNTPLPGITGPGGGKVGALFVSKYVKPNTTSDVPYNHYSFLRSMEDLFGLEHLGYASQAGLAPFGADVYDNPSGAVAAASATAPAPARTSLPATGRENFSAAAVALLGVALVTSMVRRTVFRGRPRTGSR